MRLLQATVALSLMHLGCNSSSRLNAAEDPTKARGGFVALSADEPAQPLGRGPLYLTDVLIDGWGGEIFASTDTACKERSYALFRWSGPTLEPSKVESHHGMRLFFAADKTLCFRASAGPNMLVWAGFRP